MRFSSKLPTNPGFYYWQSGAERSSQHVDIVQVVGFKDQARELEVNMRLDIIQGKVNIPISKFGGFWSGPLPQPDNIKPIWMPIETAPWHVTVLLRGDSGYIKPHDVFIINGYRVPDWHQGGWNDMTGTNLLEYGWEPTEWKRVD